MHVKPKRIGVLTTRYSWGGWEAQAVFRRSRPIVGRDGRGAQANALTAPLTWWPQRSLGPRTKALRRSEGALCVLLSL